MRKKKLPLFGNNITPSCRYCRYCAFVGDAVVCSRGRPSEDGNEWDYSCKAFSYDPLLRVPQNTPPLRPIDPEEFRL